MHIKDAQSAGHASELTIDRSGAGIHPNPHQHRLTPNNPRTSPKGGFKRGKPEPLQ